MFDWLLANYAWIKGLHIVSVIAWMAGMLYLPRLFVYHAQVEPGSEASELFKVMERRLLKAITTPAMIASLLFAGIMLTVNWAALMTQGWFHVKLVLLVGMLRMHAHYARWRRDFAEDANRHGHKFYRAMNEVPTLLMIAIVLLAVAKPF